MNKILCRAATATCLAIAICSAAGLNAEEPYQPIDAVMKDVTVTLTGHDLTIDQLVAIARHGAKVEIGEELANGAAESFGLIQQAQAEGVPVYLFNRRPGSGREITSLEGAPDSESYQAEMRRRYPLPDRPVYPTGFGQDIRQEEVGRAMLAVDLNNMRYLAASPAFVEGIAELLNRGVTPAVYWRGAIGEADFVPTGQTLRGIGFAYYRGEKMPSGEALRRAGLKPVEFKAADGNLFTTSALSAGFSALLVHDLQELVEWHDLIWAMDLNGMNGSIGPITMPVQSTRPFPWANYSAKRVLDMLKGSYVFNDEYRPIQDPESLRATVWRTGSLWEAWADLRDNVLIQMNSTDHNPTIRPGISPEDSWELSTPQMMKYYVRGGPWSNGQDGYVLSNSNWDPYPLVNDVEEVSIPLTNLMVAVVERIHRFEDTFFTITDAREILQADGQPGGPSGVGASGGGGGIVDALWQELKPLANPVAPDGVTADRGVGDLDAVPMLKLMRLRKAMFISQDILGQDLLNAAFWMTVRKIEKPERAFGESPSAALEAFRRVVPFYEDDDSRDITVAADSAANLASEFVRSHSPEEFYAKEIEMPGGKPVIPRAEPSVDH